jgi:alcohol dehydrogenase (cytochrome c)
VVTGITTDPAAPGRGFLAAYDAATGNERWRFHTVPGPDEPGDSWRHGGAATWRTGSYDPDQDLLYWGTGNPLPDYDAAARVRDNLYSDSVVALRGATGKLAWDFQFTLADDHDWDATEIPILVDRRTDAGIEKQMLFANKNGFYYILDRVAGKFLGATPFVRQNWTDGIDANGRSLPPSHPDVSANTTGRLVYPGVNGGTNWWSPSFDPALDLVFVPVTERSMYFYPGDTFPKEGGMTYCTAVRALNAATGSLAWEYRSKPTIDDGNTGSLLSTRSGLVFGSYRSTFFALAAATGRLLGSVETRGNISSSPVTYSVGGEQFVAVSAGRDLLAFALPRPH